MPDNRLTAKTQIEKLVHFFEQNIHQLKSQSFNETQARGQLIDPLFDGLGWDVHNRGMKPLYLQEVVPEGRVRTNITKEVKEQEVLFETKSGLGKAHREYASILDYIAEDNYKASFKEAIKKPDYRFRIKGQTKFFVEAKKPFVDLSKSNEAIFQVKRYGFSGRVPVSILTDFEEFRTFDCTHKPQFDKPKLGIIKEFDLKYTQYLDQFDLLYDTFSRDSVEAGSLETLTRKLLQKKTGDFALDKHFLEDLSEWREELAKDIAKHPRNRRRLNDYTLNESVQRILDRIVFFRVCEDREIEVENTLLAILQMWQGRPGISLYSLLNDLFKQRRSLYNGLLFAPHECEELEVGNQVLLKILEGLNYPFSPYYFNEIGVEILGSIYEKFLGKTIHLTPKTVRVDDKPEVRKAGGVYYTPQYIVNYIVENTVGKLIDGKSPKQIAKLKIIDIACGSGSFLLGAFQKLIDHHVQWYQEHPKDIQTANDVSDVYKDASDNLHLSARKKRDILVNNIYGVDIDRQAVEVTQMSLYLKVLEGENAETLNPQMTLALKEVYLPPLVDNIKCGNSLIGTDFASQESLFDDETRQKVNSFDWQIEFADIMKNGGFDAVIGNPPYLFITELDQIEKDYFFRKYKSAEYRFDVYGLFIELSVEKLLRENGFLGYIIPHTLLNNDSFEKLRNFLLEQSYLGKVIDIGPGVFIGAKNETMVLILQRNVNNQRSSTEVVLTNSKDFPTATKTFFVDQQVWKKNQKSSWSVKVSMHEGDLLTKIEKGKKKLNYYCTINQGLRTGDNEKYVSSKHKSSKWKPAAGGKQIGRYAALLPEIYVYYEPEVLDAPRNRGIFESTDKLVVQEVRNITLPRRLVATHDANQFFCLQSTNVINLRENLTDPPNLKFLLAFVNSTAVNYYFRQRFSGNNHIASNQLAEIPIPEYDKKMEDELVGLVDQMLDLQKQLNKASFESQKEPIQRQITATDKRIDELVYKLYGLTEEEIRIVEETEIRRQA